MIVTLCSGSASRQQRRHHGVAGLVIGAGDPLVLGHRQRLALDAHQHLVARRVEIDAATMVPAAAHREQRRLVDQVGQVGAGEAGRAAGDLPQVDVGAERHLPRVNPQDLLAPLEVRRADRDLPVEAAGPEQRRIEDVGAVGRRDDDDALVRGEAVHLDEQLVQRLLALFVAERAAAAAAADRVELVDEDDARRVAAGVLEQLADARGADAGVHLDEVRAAGEEERHARFAGHRSRQQRLAGAGRADQQHALGNAAADRREPAGLAQEVDDLLHFLLRFVDAGDVGEGDGRASRIRLAGLALERRDAAGGDAIQREAEHRRRTTSAERPARRSCRRVGFGRRPDVDADACRAMSGMKAGLAVT